MTVWNRTYCEDDESTDEEQKNWSTNVLTTIKTECHENLQALRNQNAWTTMGPWKVALENMKTVPESDEDSDADSETYNPEPSLHEFYQNIGSRNHSKKNEAGSRDRSKSKPLSQDAVEERMINLTIQTHRTVVTHRRMSSIGVSQHMLQAAQDRVRKRMSVINIVAPAEVIREKPSKESTELAKMDAIENRRKSELFLEQFDLRKSEDIEGNERLLNSMEAMGQKFREVSWTNFLRFFRWHQLEFVCTNYQAVVQKLKKAECDSDDDVSNPDWDIETPTIGLQNVKDIIESFTLIFYPHYEKFEEPCWMATVEEIADPEVPKTEQEFTFHDTVRACYTYIICYCDTTPSAGFIYQERKDVYNEYMRYDSTGCGLKLTKLFQLLEKLGVETDTMEAQKGITRLCEECDNDRSGTIDFIELLHLYRKIVRDKEYETREFEVAFIENSGFSGSEISEFHDIFAEHAQEERGTAAIALGEIRELFKKVGASFSQEEKVMINKWVEECDEDGSMSLDFGEFCAFMRRAWDANIGAIKEMSQKAVKDREIVEVKRKQEREKRKASIEDEPDESDSLEDNEYEKISWIKLLIAESREDDDDIKEVIEAKRQRKEAEKEAKLNAQRRTQRALEKQAEKNGRKASNTITDTKGSRHDSKQSIQSSVGSKGPPPISSIQRRLSIGVSSMQLPKISGQGSKGMVGRHASDFGGGSRRSSKSMMTEAELLAVKKSQRRGSFVNLGAELAGQKKDGPSPISPAMRAQALKEEKDQADEEGLSKLRNPAFKNLREEELHKVMNG